MDRDPSAILIGSLQDDRLATNVGLHANKLRAFASLRHAADLPERRTSVGFSASALDSRARMALPLKTARDGLRLTELSEDWARKQQRVALLAAHNLQCAKLQLRHDEAECALEAAGAGTPSTPLKA